MFYFYYFMAYLPMLGGDEAIAMANRRYVEQCMTLRAERIRDGVMALLCSLAFAPTATFAQTDIWRNESCYYRIYSGDLYAGDRAYQIRYTCIKRGGDFYSGYIAYDEFLDFDCDVSQYRMIDRIHSPGSMPRFVPGEWKPLKKFRDSSLLDQICSAASH